MSVVSLLEEKFKSQDKYKYRIEKNPRSGWAFILGEAVAQLSWRTTLELDMPHKRVEHTKECLKKQSITCPNCGASVLVERYEALYEGTYYSASCKECSWDSDDENGYEIIDAWLEKNNYYFTCDCPLVEVPPQAKIMAEQIFSSLYEKNQSLSESVKVKE